MEMRKKKHIAKPMNAYEYREKELPCIRDTGTKYICEAARIGHRYITVQEIIREFAEISELMIDINSEEETF
jgi:hypothetical protein